MLDWYDGILLGFDLETTGVDPFTALPVSYSFVFSHINEDGVRIYDDDDYHVVDPGIPIPADAAAIHGITDEILISLKPLGGVIELDKAIYWIGLRLLWAAKKGIPIVGMNIAYDLTIIATQLRLLDGPGLFLPNVLDIYVIDKFIDKYRKGSRKLSALCKHYGISTKKLHNASSDALATIMILETMLDRYPSLKMPIDQLFALQKKWRHQQQLELSKYFVNQGNNPIARGLWEWPIMKGNGNAENAES